MTRSGQQAELFAALHRLGSSSSPKFFKGAGTMSLYRVLGYEELSGDLAIAQAASDEAENFELAGCNAQALLLCCIYGKR